MRVSISIRVLEYSSSRVTKYNSSRIPVCNFRVSTGTDHDCPMDHHYVIDWRIGTCMVPTLGHNQLALQPYSYNSRPRAQAGHAGGHSRTENTQSTQRKAAER